MGVLQSSAAVLPLSTMWPAVCCREPSGLPFVLSGAPQCRALGPS